MAMASLSSRVASSQGRPSFQGRRSIELDAHTTHVRARATVCRVLDSGAEPNARTAANQESGSSSSNNLDMDFWHYQKQVPLWQRRPVIVGSGIAFLVAANILAEGGPCLKTTLIAAVPVALWWYILLRVLPSSFRSFCRTWYVTHPLPDQQPGGAAGPQQQAGAAREQN